MHGGAPEVDVEVERPGQGNGVDNPHHACRHPPARHRPDGPDRLGQVAEPGGAKVLYEQTEFLSLLQKTEPSKLPFDAAAVAGASSAVSEGGGHSPREAGSGREEGRRVSGRRARRPDRPPARTRGWMPDGRPCAADPSACRPVAGVAAQCRERRLHVEVETLGNHALRLLDHDPTVERALQLRPEDPQLLNALGYTLADHRMRLAVAEQHVRRALAISPDNPAIQDSLGWALYRRGRAEEALPVLERAWQNSLDAEIGSHFGEVLWKAGEESQAHYVWQQALNGSPDHTGIRATIKRLTGEDVGGG